MSIGMLIVGASINMLYPILIWLCIKFRYHLPIELLCYTIANLIEPIVYLCNKFGSGNRVQLPMASILCHYLFMSIFSGNLDHGFLKQWQYTIIILDLILLGVKALHWLMLTSEGTKALPLICSLALGLTLLMFSKEYLDLYVDLSKI